MSDKTGSARPMARVHYFDRQFLRTQDFTDEQAYHLEMRRRHNAGQHRWGIVYGLELDAQDDLAVLPGVAVDRFGRELVLGQRTPLPLIAFEEKDSEELDVWLLYSRTASDPAPNGYAADCREQEAKHAFYRWLEQPQILLTAGRPGLKPRAEPLEVSAEHLAFDPSRTPPDEVSEDWPVYLGRVTRDRSDPSKTTYVIGTGQRPYAGLVGAEVISPRDRRARIEIGGDGAGEAGAGFAVYLPEKPETADGGGDGDGDGRDQRVFDVIGGKAGGKATVHGSLTVKGDIEIREGALDFSVGHQEPAAGDSPNWRIYRVKSEAVSLSDEGGKPVEPEELRIEIVPDGEAVIGVRPADAKELKPCLTVKVEKVENNQVKPTVTVHGDLVVRGSLVELDETLPPETGVSQGQTQAVQPGPRRPFMRPRPLSADAKRLELSTFLSGVSGTPVLLDKVSSSPQAQPPTTQVTFESLAGAVAAGLAKDPEHLRRFVREVSKQGGDELHQALRDELAKPAGKGVEKGGD